MSPFDPHRHDPVVYQQLLTTDPRRHPWLRWGWTPAQVEAAQVQERRRLRGLGDVVARVTGAVGIKPCAPCKGRQARLNRWFPFS